MNDCFLLFWICVCLFDDIVLNIGVCVFVNGEQIVVFYVVYVDGGVFVIDNVDFVLQVVVMLCGLIGSFGECVVVVLLLYKQYFDLCIGECLEVFEQLVNVYLLWVEDGFVWVVV